MLNALLLLTVLTPHACGGACDHAAEDWRAGLPPDVARAVARVDAEQPQAPPKDANPPLDPRHRKDLEDDRNLGKGYAAEVAKELKFSTDEAKVQRVQRIARELAVIARENQVKVRWGDPRLNPFDYEFHVVVGEDVNAFSIPGGFIYIYEGLIDYAESDDELAGVIAHEIAHAAFRHLATLRKEQSRLEAITLPLILIALITGGEAGTNVAQAGVLANTAIGSGWSEKAEESADHGGLQYMVKSRYNPVGMLTFMERLAYDDRHRANVDWGIFRTHPPSRARARELRQTLEAQGIAIRRSAVTSSLRAQTREAEGGGVVISFAKIDLVKLGGPEAGARAAETAKRLDAFFDQTPRLVEANQFGDRTIRGRGADLIALTEEDATANGASLPDLTKRALGNMKRALYELGYRTWDAF